VEDETGSVVASFHMRTPAIKSRIQGVARLLGDWANLVYRAKKRNQVSELENSRELEQEQRRLKMANFVAEAHELRERLGEEPLPMAEHNTWVERVSEYLRTSFEDGYASPI
jgi:hypothetical protein